MSPVVLYIFDVLRAKLWLDGVKVDDIEGRVEGEGKLEEEGQERRQHATAAPFLLGVC